MRKEKGFTLIELLIVVAIIGIIAAIAIPNLLTAIQRAKQKRAMGEVRSLATAAQSYATDAQVYPIAATAFAAITTGTVNADLTPDYIKALPNPDPWNMPYWYASASAGQDFGVASSGKNTTLESNSSFGTVINAVPANTGCFENDIVWCDDAFMIKPEGKQIKCQ